MKRILPGIHFFKSMNKINQLLEKWEVHLATLTAWENKDSNLPDMNWKYGGTRKPLPNLPLASRKELLQGLKKQTQIFPKRKQTLCRIF